MTEEIIKECKNCDALGIDSEIGVYYCSLSHRQDDLPKEFTCNDFTPSEQLKRLEQENKALKKQIESQKGLITVGGKQQYQYLQRIEELERENKELREEIQFHNKENSNLLAERNAAQIGYDEIREVRERYRSALEEIRKIINGHASPSACEYWGSYKNACEPCALRILNQVEDKIQNKINECIGE